MPLHTSPTDLWRTQVTQLLNDLAILTAGYPDALPRNLSDWAEDAAVTVTNLSDGYQSAVTLDDEYEGSSDEADDLLASWADWLTEQRAADRDAVRGRV